MYSGGAAEYVFMKRYTLTFFLFTSHLLNVDFCVNCKRMTVKKKKFKQFKIRYSLRNNQF